MKPKDVRVLRVDCDHSDYGKWRVHLLEEEWKALSESYDRIFQDRYDLLTVHTKEGMLASEWLMRTATAERERNEARERCAFAEQRALDAECERDACRGMEQAAELRGERLFRDRALVDERARRAAQLLIAEVGAEGPMNVDDAAKAAVDEIHRLKKRVVELEWGNEMACENTPYPECECPGCSLARDRARRGVAGPEDV